jgi:kynureninase
VIYLDGNSLGCAPEAAMGELARAAEEEWARDLIGSWNKASWFELPTAYGDLIAPIVGAEAGRWRSATRPRSTSSRRCTRRWGCGRSGA